LGFAGAREHDPHHPAPRRTAGIRSPLGHERVLGISRAKLTPVVKHDAVGRRVRGKHGDWPHHAPAVPVEAPVRVGRPATRPPRIPAIDTRTRWSAGWL